MNSTKGVKKGIMYYVKLFDIDEVIKSLKLKKTVTIGFRCFSGIYETKTGLVPMPNEGELYCDNHSVAIVEYFPEQNLFLFINSWGAEWGNKGYGYFSYEYLKKYMFEAWMFELDKKCNL